MKKLANDIGDDVTGETSLTSVDLLTGLLFILFLLFAITPEHYKVLISHELARMMNYRSLFLQHS